MSFLSSTLLFVSSFHFFSTFVCGVVRGEGRGAYHIICGKKLKVHFLGVAQKGENHNITTESLKIHKSQIHIQHSHIHNQSQYNPQE